MVEHDIDQTHFDAGRRGCGANNAARLRAVFKTQGSEIVGTLQVTDVMVGAPGRLHGGVMMAFLDEALEYVSLHRGVDTMTAGLTVDMRAPAFVGATLHQRAWLERRDGRKWFVRAVVHDGDHLLAEARGLWIETRAPEPVAAVA